MKVNLFCMYAIFEAVKETSIATVPRHSQLEGYRIGLGTQPGSQECDE